MSNIKLKVGGRYLTRNGTEITITNYNANYRYPFLATNGSRFFSWDEAGKYINSETFHPLDIIKELTPDQNAPT